MMENERAERKNVDKRTETDEDDNEFILVTCSRCRHPIEAEQYEKITVISRVFQDRMTSCRTMTLLQNKTYPSRRLHTPLP